MTSGRTLIIKWMLNLIAILVIESFGELLDIEENTLKCLITQSLSLLIKKNTLVIFFLLIIHLIGQAPPNIRGDT